MAFVFFGCMRDGRMTRQRFGFLLKDDKDVWIGTDILAFI